MGDAPRPEIGYPPQPISGPGGYPISDMKWSTPPHLTPSQTWDRVPPSAYLRSWRVPYLRHEMGYPPHLTPSQTWDRVPPQSISGPGGYPTLDMKWGTHLTWHPPRHEIGCTPRHDMGDAPRPEIGYPPQPISGPGGYPISDMKWGTHLTWHPPRPGQGAPPDMI